MGPSLLFSFVFKHYSFASQNDGQAKAQNGGVVEITAAAPMAAL
jgi:hypothetical protein